MHIVKHTEAMYVDSQLDRTEQTTDMWVRWVQMHLAHKLKLHNLNKMVYLLQEILANNVLK